MTKKKKSKKPVEQQQGQISEEKPTSEPNVSSSAESTKNQNVENIESGGSLPVDNTESGGSRPVDNTDYSINKLKQDLIGIKLRDKTESEIQELHSKLTQDKNKYKPMARPGFGTEGKPVSVITNWLDMEVSSFKIYMYDVTIERQKINRTVNVAGSSESKSRAVRRREDNYRVFMEFVKRFPELFQYEKMPLYDRSKIMYSSNCIKQFSKNLKAKILDEDEIENPPTYTIHVKPTDAEINFNVNLFSEQYQEEPHNRMRKLLAVMDQFCRQKMYNDSLLEVVGKSLYEFKNNLNIELGSGRQLVYGTYQSPALHGTIKDSKIGWKFHLNIDVIASAFYKKHEEQEKMSAMNFLIELIGMRQIPNKLEDHQIAKINKEIRGMEFKTTHNQHRFKAHGLSRDRTPKTHKFKIDRDDGGFKAGEEVNLVEYFKRRYNLELKYVNWPLLEKKSSQGKYTYFPVELCFQANHHRVPNIKLTGDQQGVIVRQTALCPLDRLQMINERASTISQKHNMDEVFKLAGIHIKPELIIVPARELPPPKVVDKAPVRDLGLASWNMVNRSLRSGIDCSKDCLALISVQNAQRTGSQFVRGGRGGGRGGQTSFGQPMFFSPDHAYNFYCNFQPHLEKMGLNLPYEPLLNEIASANMNDKCNISNVIEEFDRRCNRMNPNRKIVILINSNKDENAYALAKYECGNRGIFCQAILATNAMKIIKDPMKSGQLMSNMALKMNAKLCGINHVVEDNPLPNNTKIINTIFKKQDVLVLGLDVTHDTLGRSVSIGALVSSINCPPSRYIAREIIMPPKTEIVEHGKMKSAIIEALHIFKQRTKVKPLHIIYYRDGVSDGQFVEVLIRELAAIQDACTSLNIAYKPCITFVVVQKRHQTRLFNPNMKKGDKPMYQNVTPGTVVDREITHPFEFNFYIVPHSGIQGTSRPLHCYVLHDDKNMGADVVQQLTNYLCYTYARATKAVSLPAPAYYAHHVCTQAKMRLLGHQLKNSSCSQSTFLSDSLEKSWSAQEIQELQNTIKMHPAVADGMHFQ